MGRRFQLIPTGPQAAGRILSRGIGAQIAGILVLSVALFAKAPLLLVVVIPLGALLVVLGFLAWLWVALWGESG